MSGFWVLVLGFRDSNFGLRYERLGLVSGFGVGGCCLGMRFMVWGFRVWAMGVGFGVRCSILSFNFGVCVCVLFWGTGLWGSGYRFWGSWLLDHV